MSALRDRIAVAMSGTEGHFGDKLDAVMAVVDHVEQERDEARASVEHLRSDCRDIGKDRDRLRLAWRSARERASRIRTARDRENRSRFSTTDALDLITELAALRDSRDGVVWCIARDAPSPRCVERTLANAARADLDAERDSRFRWAEEAAALQAKLDGPCGSCHPCVNWGASATVPPEEALTAALEAHQSAIVSMDEAGPEFDAQYAAHVALGVVRSWRPAIVDAAPQEDLMVDIMSGQVLGDIMREQQGARGETGTEEATDIRARVDELETVLADAPAFPGIDRYSMEQLQSLRHMVKHRLQYGDQPMVAETGTEASDAQQ